MEATLTRIWASPSTLHLRLMIQPKNGRWSQFVNLSVPWETIPSEVRTAILMSDRFDRDEQHEQPLF